MNLNVDVAGYELGVRAMESGKWVFVADIVRLEKLVEEDGFYLDSDVELSQQSQCATMDMGGLGFVPEE